MAIDAPIDAKILLRIAHKIGTPAIVLSEALLLAQTRAFVATAHEQLPDDHIIFYSMKTNDTVRAIASVKELVHGVEIISEEEFDVASTFVDPGRLIVNGPNKGDALLRKAISADAYCINIDSFSDAQRIEGLAQQLLKEVRVGVRVATSHNASWSQFGLRPDGDEMRAVTDLIKHSKHLLFQGMHYHGEHHFERAGDLGPLLTFIADTKGLLEKRLGPLRSINLGGGWAPALRLDAGLSWVKDPSTAHAFAQIREMWRRFEGTPPTLVLEPGRALIEASSVGLATVGNVKIDGARRFTFLDLGTGYLGGRHVCEACIRYVKLGNSTPASSPAVQHVLCGPLCYGSDILSTVELSELRAGDVVAMANAGAYTLTLRWHGSAPVPRVVWLPSAGAWHRIDYKGVGECRSPT